MRYLHIILIALVSIAMFGCPPKKKADPDANLTTGQKNDKSSIEAQLADNGYDATVIFYDLDENGTTDIIVDVKSGGEDLGTTERLNDVAQPVGIIVRDADHEKDKLFIKTGGEFYMADMETAVGCSHVWMLGVTLPKGKEPAEDMSTCMEEKWEKIEAD